MFWLVSGTYKPVQGAFGVLAIVFFFVNVIIVGYFIAWLRLRTGSIWPCIVAHSAWNAITQVVFDSSTRGATTSVWIGESGLLVGLAILAVTVAIFLRWPLRQMFARPGQPLVIGPEMPIADENTVRSI